MPINDFKKSQGDLANHWYIIALESEIPSFKPVQRWVFGVPYVLFRDKENSIAVMEDRCPHRGAKLSEGTCINGTLKCPYHGWEFDSKAEIVSVPSEGPDFRTRDWKGFHVPSFTQDGCVWIWTGAGIAQPPSPPWRFPKNNDPKACVYFMKTDFENQVGPLVQNFMDVPHTVFVHSKWFRNRSLIKVPAKIQIENGRVKITYLQPKDSIGFLEGILNPKKKPMIHTDEFIFPNITRVDYEFGDYYFVINSQCTPVSEFNTRVFTWIAYYVGLPTKAMSMFMKFYTRQVIEQDVRIMKNQVQHLKFFNPQSYFSTGADEHHLAIERMIQTGLVNKDDVFKLNYQRDREFWI